VLVDQGRSHRAVAHTVHEFQGGRGELVAGVPAVMEVEPDRETGFDDCFGPARRSIAPRSPPEQHLLRTGAGVLLHVSPEFRDEEVRQGDVPDPGDPLARNAKGVPHVTPTRT
jgi:hypothetical protein